MILKIFTTVALAAASLLTLAAPAQAVVTTFADYAALAGTTSNIYWRNNGTNGSNGTGGSIYTIATNVSTTAGSRLVSFSFLQPSIAPYVTNVNALFTLNASVTNTAATLIGSFLIQPGIAGTFAFLSTAPITINNTFYATGSNLLSATFSQAAIFGQRSGTAGSFSAFSASPADTVVYSSDFLSFDLASSLDFALSLTAISNVLQATPTSVPRTARCAISARSARVASRLIPRQPLLRSPSPLSGA